MLLRRATVTGFVYAIALMTTISAHAGLYGFTQTEDQPHAEHLQTPPRHIVNYRKEMRDLFIAIAEYGKSRNKQFQILAHEGQYLLNKSLWEYHLDGYNKIRYSDKTVDDVSFLNIEAPEEEEDRPAYVTKYIDSLDGMAVNNHYCQNRPLDSLLNDHEIPVISIEQCPDDAALDKAILQSLTDNIILYPFLHKSQAFRRVHQQLIINENANGIISIKDARNIGFILNDEQYASSFMLLNEIRQSNYDIIVINPVFRDGKPFTKEDVNAMKYKKNGARRLVLAVYNISETKETDFFWRKKWHKILPDWIAAKSPTNENAYVVKYWMPQWKDLTSRYFKSIVNSGYDGAFITGLENHELFEHNKPLE